MRMMNVSIVCRTLIDQRGQVLPVVALGMVGLLGMGGLTIDVGRAYVVRSQLQGTVNAAALAGVSGLSSGNAASIATQYENLNINPQWGTLNTPTPMVSCVQMMMPTTQTCAGSGVQNAIKVTASVNVQTFFMKMLGYPTLTVGATATASPGEARPWIVQFIVDTTPSMNTVDTNCGSKTTAEQCALYGIQGLLAKTNPCASSNPNCTAATSNIRFGLMTFPNIKSSDAVDEYGANCTSAATPSYQLYSLPVIPVLGQTTPYTPITYGTGGTALSLTYQTTLGASDADSNGFYTNYYSSSKTTGNLNTSSSLIKAVGYNGSTGTPPCVKVVNSGYPSSPGGGVTSFAGVLYAAQTALLAEHNAYPQVNGAPTRTAIVFLSDGQANAFSSEFPAAGTAVSTNGMNSGGKSIMNDPVGTGTKSSPYLPTSVSGAYPSGFDACQQAIGATQNAIKLGIRVYTVAYGAENGGCLFYQNGTSGTALAGKGTDVNPLLNLGALQFPFGSITGVVPCTVMENMASDPQYFYSDYNSKTGTGGTGIDDVNPNCISSANSSVSSLNDIFQDIYGSLTGARLIPNDAQ